MAFTPFTIPMNAGLRQDLESKGAANPSMLDVMTNCVITHNGSLRSRPSLESQNTITQSANVSVGSPVTQTTTLASVVNSDTNNSAIPAGLEVTDSQLLAMWQGRGYARSSKLFDDPNNTPWRDIGPFWSFRKEVSPYFDSNVVGLLPFGGTSTAIPPVHTGTNVVNIPVVSGNAIGLPISNNSGINLYDTLALTNYDGVSQAYGSVASNSGLDLILYPKADGSLWMHTVGPVSVPGLGTEINLSGAGTVNVTVLKVQRMWAVAGNTATSGEFYAAVMLSTAGQVRVYRLTTSGAAGSVLITGLGSLDSGVCLAANGNTIASGNAKLVLGYVDSATNTYKTKIINVTSTTTLVDAGTNTNYTAASALNVATQHTVGFVEKPAGAPGMLYLACFIQNNATPALDACVLFSNRDNSITPSEIFIFFVSSFATNANSSGTGAIATSFGAGFVPFLPPKLFNNTPTIGLHRIQSDRAQPPTSSGSIKVAQWFILDLTNVISSSTPNSNGSVYVMACGQSDFNMATGATNQVIDTVAGTYKFGVKEITSFGSTAIAGASQSANTNIDSSCVITLTLCPANGAHVNNTMYFSGCSPVMFDGNDILPVNFYEGYPTFFLNSVTAGGVAPTGSYTIQVIWELTCSNGKRIRSKPSIPYTVTTTIANAKINIGVSVPQMVSHTLSNNKALKIKVYCTQTNAASNSTLNLVQAVPIPITNGVIFQGPVSISLFPTGGSAPPIAAYATEEILYTVGNVYEDSVPPSADRGVAMVNNRLWTADYKTIYSSKLFSTQFSPAWNTSGALSLAMNGIGEIVGLGALIDKLVVVGTNGVAIVYGPGVDDLGNGPGWTVEILPNTRAAIKSPTQIITSVIGPRCVTTIPNLGVVYLGVDNEVWLIDANGRSQCISRQTKDVVSVINDIVYCDPTKGVTGTFGQVEHGPLLLLNGADTKVFDIESGKWGTWNTNTLATPLTGALMCSLYGVVYVQPVNPVNNTTKGIFSFSGWGLGQDIDPATGGLVPFSMSVSTSTCSVAGPQEGNPSSIWGRLRSVSPVIKQINGGTVLMQVTPEGYDVSDGVFLINKTFNLGTSPTAHWPYEVTPEFRTTVQRCSRFKINMTVTPANIELSAFDCWSWAGGDKAPSSGRM